MSSFVNHPAVQDPASGKRGIYKGLHVGASGAGKTGAIAALIDAGYKVRALDFDRGLDPIAGYTKKRANLSNVDYHTLVDEFKIVGQALVVKKAPAFQRAMALLEKWVTDDGEDFGPVQSWGDDTILLIDTLGSMGRSSLNMVLNANGVLGAQGTKGGPEQSHWGTAMDNVERLLLQLTNPDLVPCHLIVNAHWTYQEDSSGAPVALPEALGTKLNPKVARNFNNMLGFSLQAGQRKIKTQRDGVVTLKTSKPLKNPDYPLDTGLADIFKEIVGPHPAAA